MQTTNLPTSRLLKEAGFPQEGNDFFWVRLNRGEFVLWHYLKLSDPVTVGWDNIAALTADEILDRLPIQLKTKEFLSIQKFNTYWVGYGVGTKTYVHFDSESLADAAAKAWLWLKKENLL